MDYLSLYRQLAKNSPDGVRFNLLLRNYFSWRASLQPGKSPMNDGMPWMTFDAIRFLKKKLNKTMNVFEFGSGGSSVFFSRLTLNVISAEHDKNWYLEVEQRIHAQGIENWKGILCAPEEMKVKDVGDAADPDAYSSSDQAFRSYSFEKYVKIIDQFPDQHFDLVVIDGRSRPSCIKHSVSKVKKGGYLLLDNAERESYSKAIGIFLKDNYTLKIKSFGPTSYNKEFTMTKIWERN